MSTNQNKKSFFFLFVECKYLRLVHRCFDISIFHAPKPIIWLFFRNGGKKVGKNVGSSKKSSTFAPANQLSRDNDSNRLGYGVMVTLQILVLSFLVRVRVPQPNQSLSNRSSVLSDFLYNRIIGDRGAIVDFYWESLIINFTTSQCCKLLVGSDLRVKFNFTQLHMYLS